VYVLEVNPRASRTLPFVAKATGVPWAQIATRAMLGEALAEVLCEHGIAATPMPGHTAVKAPVFPFHKFPGVDVILGPEMRSTGEVMAIAPTFGQAFAKAQIATGLSLPTAGNVLVSVRDPDKPRIVSIARELHDLGFRLFSTLGTRSELAAAGIPSTLVSKQGRRAVLEGPDRQRHLATAHQHADPHRTGVGGGSLARRGQRPPHPADHNPRRGSRGGLRDPYSPRRR
jgi:carbamoyl-phosphate synthase large subunit